MKPIFPRVFYIVASLLAVAPSLAGDELPFRDPIPESIEWGNLVIHVEEWLTFPWTKEGNKKTRINAMKPSVDGTDRLWVCDLEGLLYFIEDDHIHTYLDVRDHLAEFYAEKGLGGGLNFFAFHPAFKTNGRFYTVHSELLGKKEADFVGKDYENVSALDGILLEWKTEDSTASTFKGTYRELLRVRFPVHIHTMQDISFNPRSKPGDEDYGLLYIGIGEGGSMKSQQYGNIHRLDSLLGTIARIDPAGNDSFNGQYGIPPGNPWAQDGDDNTLGEIWAYGFRNPHWLIWDSGGSGKFLATEIGESNIEEINLIEPGRNYGWPNREGSFEFQLDPNKFSLLPLPADDAGFSYPVAQYDHSEGDGIIGGGIYRGKQHPLLLGKYVFGDIVRGHLYYCNESDLQFGGQAEIKKLRLQLDGKETRMVELSGSRRVDLRIGIDNSGEFYLMEKFGGQVFRIIRVTEN